MVRRASARPSTTSYPLWENTRPACWAIGLKRCGDIPDLVATGTPSRQLNTAALCLAATGGPARASWLTLDGLGEYDHEGVVTRYRPDYVDPEFMRADLTKDGGDYRRAFHAMYLRAIARWTEGGHDADYPESWTAFKIRVLESLRHLISSKARTAIAFTSGGPITAIMQHLLGLTDDRAFTLNWPLVNAGMTRLRFSAETGTMTLATYNAHPHLDETGDPAFITFR